MTLFFLNTGGFNDHRRGKRTRPYPKSGNFFQEKKSGAILFVLLTSLCSFLVTGASQAQEVTSLTISDACQAILKTLKATSNPHEKDSVNYTPINDQQIVDGGKSISSVLAAALREDFLSSPKYIMHEHLTEFLEPAMDLAREVSARQLVGQTREKPKSILEIETHLYGNKSLTAKIEEAELALDKLQKKSIFRKKATEEVFKIANEILSCRTAIQSCKLDIKGTLIQLNHEYRLSHAVELILTDHLKILENLQGRHTETSIQTVIEIKKAELNRLLAIFKAVSTQIESVIEVGHTVVKDADQLSSDRISQLVINAAKQSPSLDLTYLNPETEEEVQEKLDPGVIFKDPATAALQKLIDLTTSDIGIRETLLNKIYPQIYTPSGYSWMVRYKTRKALDRIKNQINIGGKINIYLLPSVMEILVESLETLDEPALFAILLDPDIDLPGSLPQLFSAITQHPKAKKIQNILPSFLAGKTSWTRSRDFSDQVTEISNYSIGDRSKLDSLEILIRKSTTISQDEFLLLAAKTPSNVPWGLPTDVYLKGKLTAYGFAKRDLMAIHIKIEFNIIFDALEKVSIRDIESKQNWERKVIGILTTRLRAAYPDDNFPKEVTLVTALDNLLLRAMQYSSKRCYE